MMEKKNVLVTGGSGFIGRHFLEAIDTDLYNVILLSRNPELKFAQLSKTFSSVKADLNDFESLNLALKGIDILVNLAAEVRDDKLLEKTNIAGSENIVKAAVQNSVSKIIHLSSVGVVGMQYNSYETIVDENSPCHPKNEYERTKLESERILIKGCGDHKIKLQVLRPTNVFGEYHPHMALKTMLVHICENKPMLATKNAQFNFLYVKDLTGVVVDFLSYNGPSGVFNIGESRSIKDFVYLAQTILNKPKRIYIIPDFIVKAVRTAGISKLNVVSNRVAYSDDKLNSIFKYKFGIETGVKNTVDFFKQKGILK